MIIDPSGSLEATGGSVFQVTGNLTSSASVSVDGSSTAKVSGTMILNGLGVLSVRPGGTVSVGGDLIGSTQNADLFAPLGGITLNGNGTATAPQHLEVMSRDFGALSDAFERNFAYQTLTVGSNTYVRLIDIAHNSSGTGSEALYANALISSDGINAGSQRSPSICSRVTDRRDSGRRNDHPAPERREVGPGRSSGGHNHLSKSGRRLELFRPGQPGRHGDRQHRQWGFDTPAPALPELCPGPTRRFRRQRPGDCEQCPGRSRSHPGRCCSSRRRCLSRPGPGSFGSPFEHWKLRSQYVGCDDSHLHHQPESDLLRPDRLALQYRPVDVLGSG